VGELGRDFDLANEPLRAEGGRQLRPQHLHRDFAVVLEILGQIDGGHAAATRFPLDGVAVGKGGRESFGRVSHGHRICDICAVSARLTAPRRERPPRRAAFLES